MTAANRSFLQMLEGKIITVDEARQALVRDDADTLRSAATILRYRSTKPRGLWLRIYTRVLHDVADKIETERS